MIITFCVFGISGKGGDRVEVELANGFSRKGHTVNIVLPKDSYSGDFPFDKKVNLIETKSLLKRPPYPPYFELISSFFILPPYIPRSDVIIAPFCLHVGAALIASKLLNRGKAIYLVHHYDPLYFESNNPIVHTFRSGYRWYARKTYKCFDKDTMIVISNWDNEYIYKECKSEGVVINPGIDHKVFYPRGKYRERDRYIISHIAHWGYWKGLHTLLEAIDIVYSKIKNIEFVSIARKFKEKINCKCPWRGIEGSTDEELAEVYSQSTVFVYASEHEGFGLAPLEAMACGSPVVLTDSGGIREFAVDGENCLIVPPNNSSMLADAILKVLENDKLRYKLRKNGIETAGHFSWDKMVDHFEKFLEKAREE